MQSEAAAAEIAQCLSVLIVSDGMTALCATAGGLPRAFGSSCCCCLGRLVLLLSDSEVVDAWSSLLNASCKNDGWTLQDPRQATSGDDPMPVTKMTVPSLLPLMYTQSNQY
jgi:hypothetical protein